MAVSSPALSHTLSESPHWLGWDEPTNAIVHYPRNDPIYQCNAYNGYSQLGWCNNVVQEAGNFWAANSDWKPIRLEPSNEIRVIIDNYGTNFYGSTPITYYPDTGHIDTVYVQINAYLMNSPHGGFSTGDTTLQKRCTAAHEWGHVAGLRHHFSTTTSIMYIASTGEGHVERCHNQGMTSAQPHDIFDVQGVH